MTNPDTLLVFDEAVTRAGVERWIQHLESAGAPTEMYRLGSTHVLSGSDADLIPTARPAHPPPSVDGWIQHLESAGAPTEMYRLGSTHVLSVSDADLIAKAGPELPVPT